MLLLLRYFIFISIVFFCNTLFAQNQKINISQEELPNYIPQMARADFWLNKISNPQALIWSEKKINDYNNRNLKKGRVLNPYAMGTGIQTSSVRKFLDEDLGFLRRYIKYDLKGIRRRDPEFNNFLKKLIDYKGLEAKSFQTIRYGLVVNKEAELRYAPTDLKIYRNLKDREFEILKKSHLDPFYPVAIMWESADTLWYYVETPLSRGWMKKTHLVTGSQNEIKNFFSGESSGVVINPSVKIYHQNKSEFRPLSLPMGNVVYYRNYDPQQEFTEIIIPENRRNGKPVQSAYFIKTKDFNPEYLTFNYKNLLEQAFKYLDTPYSWGGGYNSTDCSLFLYRVYRTFGIIMPRSSSKQIVSLNYQEIFSKGYPQFSAELSPLKVIAHIPGPTHILLYLGNHMGRDYYIHSTWSFYSPREEYLIRSVVISDLTLGKNGKWGSLEQRISRLGFF